MSKRPSQISRRSKNEDDTREEEPLRRSQNRRSSGLQVPGLPRPGKTTQGFARRSSMDVHKSFRTIKNFWKQMEGNQPQPVRRVFRKPQPVAEEPVKPVRRPSLKKKPSVKPRLNPPGLATIPEEQETKSTVGKEGTSSPGKAEEQPQSRKPSGTHPENLNATGPSQEGRRSRPEGRKSLNARPEVQSSSDAQRTSRKSGALQEISRTPENVHPSTRRSQHSRASQGAPQQREDIQNLINEDISENEESTEDEDDDEEDQSHQSIGSLHGDKTSKKSSHGAQRPLGTSQQADRLEAILEEDENLMTEARSEAHHNTGTSSNVPKNSNISTGTKRLSQPSSHIPPPPPPMLPAPPPLPRPPSFFKPPSLWQQQGVKDVVLRRPSIFLPLLLDEEKVFHELVSEGNLPGVQDFLEEHPNFNINCTNYQGVSALHIAVKAGDEAMVEYLLLHPSTEIGDAHLFAVRDNHPIILKMILDKLHLMNPALEFMACAHSPEFAENVTPLILAAQSGHYEIIKILLDRGHVVPVPHPPRCFCKEECLLILETQDPLSISSGKLHIYRALSNPAYICQTSDDPILTAFNLSKELLVCGEMDLIHIRQYEAMADATRAFAVDLIAECRSLEEVETVLSEHRGSNIKSNYTFPRLIMAVDLKQKEFVAHPNVQIVLDKAWLGGWIAWNGYKRYIKIFIVVSRLFMLPAILVILMIAPTSSWAKHYAIPINKFLSAIASYSIFLILIFIQSNVDKHKQTRDTKPSGVEIFLILYVFTFIYNSIRTMLIEGPKRYFKFLWNIYEVTMLILFLLTFYFWIYAAIRTTVTGEKDLERKYWHYMDAELIAEGTFVLASIMAYMKTLLLCQISYDLGPLQVSLGKMTNDCTMFSVIFGIIILAFTVGLCKFYNYYEGMSQKNPDTGEEDSKQENSFTSFLDTFKTLFWGLFGMSSFEAADVVIENLTDEKGEPVLNEHHFTEAIGYFVFAVYMVLTVIVILNMLIATMSNTFQQVTENVDTEWAFGRTEVKLSYMNLPVLPPPFNVIPTTRGVVNLVKGARAAAAKVSGLDVEKGLIEDEKKNEEFSALMSQLVQRYFSTKSEEEIT